MPSVELNRKELLKIEEYLRDEVREHPAIFGAVVNGIKTNKSKVIYSVTPKELALLKKILAVKNPLSSRTKKLRDSGVLKDSEWIGGNEFYRVHPKVSRFAEAEKYGQLRMELNPKKKKKTKAKKKAKKKILVQKIK